MKTFLITVGIVLVLIWIIRLLYYLGDERRRFRIVETRNKEYRVEKMGLFIQIWWTAWIAEFISGPNDDRLYTYVDFGQSAEYGSLEGAKSAVDKHFAHKEKGLRDKEIINTWYLNEKS